MGVVTKMVTPPARAPARHWKEMGMPASLPAVPKKTMRREISVLWRDSWIADSGALPRTVDPQPRHRPGTPCSLTIPARVQGSESYVPSTDAVALCIFVLATSMGKTQTALTVPATPPSKKLVVPTSIMRGPAVAADRRAGLSKGAELNASTHVRSKSMALPCNTQFLAILLRVRETILPSVSSEQVAVRVGSAKRTTTDECGNSSNGTTREIWGTRCNFRFPNRSDFLTLKHTSLRFDRVD